jgi:hypothetical protein
MPQGAEGETFRAIFNLLGLGGRVQSARTADERLAACSCLLPTAIDIHNDEITVSH